MNPSSLDSQLFLKINGYVGQVPIIDNTVKLVANEYFIPVTLALLILYLWFAKSPQIKTKRQSLSLALLAVGLVNLMIVLLNQFIVRPRPFDQLPTKLLFYKPTDPSFPSNAAAVSFALATAIFLVNRKLGVFALLLAILYSFSRVYAGVHFPGDVVSGAVIGILSTILVSRFQPMVKFLTNFIERAQKNLKLNLDS